MLTKEQKLRDLKNRRNEIMTCIAKEQACPLNDIDYDVIKVFEDELKDYDEEIACLEKNDNDPVNHPKHYEREGAMQCIDEMIMLYGPYETSIFCKLNAHKYRYRAADKNGSQDIAKSDWYMREYKELIEKINGGVSMNGTD